MSDNAAVTTIPEDAKYDFSLTPNEWREIFAEMQRRPERLFLDKELRRYFAVKRAERFNMLDTFSQEVDDAVAYAVSHNARMMKNFAEAQVTRLLRPLSVIDPVWQNAKNLKVLSVGPRNEMELLHLAGLGFDLRNVTAIDLVRNSPLVEIADMHSIPYPDNHFDVVISGWVISYSKNHQGAVDELIRVTKPEGLLALGVSYLPPGYPDLKMVEENGSRNYFHTDELLELFGNHAKEVPFRHDAHNKAERSGLCVIVRVGKDGSAATTSQRPNTAAARTATPAAKPAAQARYPKAEFSRFDNIDWYRQLMLDLRYSIPMTSYESFASILANAINKRLQFPAVAAGIDRLATKADAEALKRDGFLPLGQLLTPEQVQDVHKYLADKRAPDMWKRTPGKFLPEEVPESVNIIEYEASVVRGTPHIFEAANHPRVLSAVAQYLGVPPTIQRFDMWYSPPGRPAAKDAQLHHIDRHCYRFMKLFIFLTDVDMDSGPHIYARGSHRIADIEAKMRELRQTNPPEAARFAKMLTQQRKSDKDVADFFGEENIVPITGKAGEAFIGITSGIHKGLVPKTQGRFLFQTLFTMVPTIKDPVFLWNEPNAIDRLKARYGEAYDDDHWAYMNRLVCML